MDASDFLPESIATAAFFTGHRIIPENMKERVSSSVYQCLLDAYDAGYRKFYCGCALGFDTLAAFQTVRLRRRYPDVILSLAIPCEDQSSGWKEKDRDIYRRVLELADEKTVLSPFYYKGVMLSRNRYMADRSSLCICYLVRMSGGTASTVRYALTHDRIRIINLAVGTDNHSCLLREKKWNCTFTSPSVSENAVIAPLRLMPQRKMTMRNTSPYF